MCDVMKERKKERRKEGKKNFSPDFLLVWCGVVWVWLSKIEYIEVGKFSNN